jgi:hypothetical protein
MKWGDNKRDFGQYAFLVEKTRNRKPIYEYRAPSLAKHNQFGSNHSVEFDDKIAYSGQDS